MSAFTESAVEDAVLAWLDSLGWSVKHGPDIAPVNWQRSGQTMRAAEAAGYPKLR